MTRARQVSRLITTPPDIYATDDEINSSLEDYISKNDGYAPRQVVYFTSSGTFTKATYPWLRAIRVRIAGGGGGGGGSNNNNTGGGGGGGAYIEKFVTDIAGLDASITITVGANGVGGAAGANNGTAGGNTSFGTLIVAGGGGGGQANTGSFVNDNGGDIVTAGDLNIPGGDGGPRGTLLAAINAAGGGSFLGFPGAQLSSTGSNMQGLPGRGYGGGGSGGRRESFDQAGGNGAAGIVIVELYA